MGNPAIRVERLGKRYQLGARTQRYRTFREAMTNLATAPARWLRREGAEERHFWALKDVNFEIEKGDVVGIIGRNGAGKSTLLKILSNITEPTEGEARVYGRLSSLLEVGTGFHPELTGRENVYLNGAILGMPRAEIDRRFDEIVAFAEVEKFLDTPAKHYSSGMYMRLAFSVAAHLTPDILVIDEVLAVGDADFQAKCLGKIEEVGREGRTVIFVSHSMPMVLRLCGKAMLLQSGRFTKAGLPGEVIAAYLGDGSAVTGERVWESFDQAPGDAVARLHAVRVRDHSGKVVDSVDVRSPVTIEIDWWNRSEHVCPSANLTVHNEQGVCLFVTGDFHNPHWRRGDVPRGLVRSVCRIPGNFFAEGRVIVHCAAVTSYNPTTLHALERDAVSFHVVDKSEGDAVRGPYGGEWPGVLRPMLEWDVTPVERSGA